MQHLRAPPRPVWTGPQIFHLPNRGLLFCLEDTINYLFFVTKERRVSMLCSNCNQWRKDLENTTAERPSLRKGRQPARILMTLEFLVSYLNQKFFKLCRINQDVTPLPLVELMFLWFGVGRQPMLFLFCKWLSPVALLWECVEVQKNLGCLMLVDLQRVVFFEATCNQTKDFETQAAGKRNMFKKKA